MRKGAALLLLAAAARGHATIRGSSVEYDLRELSLTEQPGLELDLTEVFGTSTNAELAPVDDEDRRRLDLIGTASSNAQLDNILVNEPLVDGHRVEGLAFDTTAGEWLVWFTGSTGSDNGEDSAFKTTTVLGVNTIIDQEIADEHAITTLAFGFGTWYVWSNDAVFTTGEQRFTETSLTRFVREVFRLADEEDCYPTNFATAQGVATSVCAPKAGVADWKIGTTRSNTDLLAFMETNAADGFAVEALDFIGGFWVVYLEQLASGSARQVGFGRQNSASNMQAAIIQGSNAGFGQVSALAFGNGQFVVSMRPDEDGVPDPIPPVAGSTTVPTESPTPKPTDRPTELITGSPTASAKTNAVSVVFPGPVAANIEAEFREAEARWNEIILGEPSVFPLGSQVGNLNQRCGVDFPLAQDFDVVGLLIVAEVVPIDGPGRVLGQAGPCIVLQGKTLVGTMKFDVDDLNGLLSRGTLSNVILHEIGHVLGIGTLWASKGLVTGLDTNDPRYIGANAVEGLNDLGDPSSSIDVANTGGGGTFGGHWREATFRNEAMTGFSNGDDPLSVMSVKALIDLGYEVDITKADSFAIPGLQVFSASAPPSEEIVDDILPTDFSEVFYEEEDSSNVFLAVGAAAGATAFVLAGAFVVVRKRRGQGSSATQSGRMSADMPAAKNDAYEARSNNPMFGQQQQQGAFNPNSF